MDTTVRNLDPDAYRRIKARAALDGKTVGEAVSEAMRRYVEAGSAVAGGRPHAGGSLRPAGEVAEAAEPPADGAAWTAGSPGPPLPNAAPTLSACLERLAELSRPDAEYLDELEAIQAAQPDPGPGAWES